MEITRHFLFNLSLLLICMYVFHNWSERKGSTRTRWLIYYIGSILLCSIFSYYLEPTSYLDLRNVPVIVGGLYIGMGHLLSAAAFVTWMICLSGSGFIPSILYYTFLGFLLWRIHPWFTKQTAKIRIWATISITFTASVVNLFLIGPGILPPGEIDIWFAYLLIPPISAYILSHSLETFKETSILRNHLLKSKKFEIVEQMGAAISHEIRNPLTAAIGFIQLLQEEQISPAKRKEYLSLVKGELESAEKVIQDYLMFSKPSLETLEVLNVRRELMHVVAIIQPLANKHSVHIDAALTGVGFIEGDSQKFHQCFINVLKNGIESMPSGGHLIIETFYSPGHVSIIIKDTGIGMSKEQLERLGEPYYSTKGGKGTGLGMMVVYSIVRAMKGTIHVDSIEGKGTAFHFVFPAAKTLRKAH